MKAGDIVLCVNDTKSSDLREWIDECNFPVLWIKKDKKYTIREVLENDGIATGLLLEEIINFPFYIPLLNRSQELGYAVWRFRKVQEVPDNVEVEKEENVI
jgi:hypothetical protein